MSEVRGCPDKPVSKISEDLFEVSRYVDGLCSFVRSCDTPMTISIQGDWGSGKTSMMNMMKESLEASIWPIWFNTWQFSQFNMGNSLVFSMMDVLLNGLDCDKTSIVKILGGIAKNVVRVATDRVAGGVVEGMVSEAIDWESSDFASEVLALKQKFQDAVNKKLAKEHRDRVVVFVDDLDRLQPLRAIELLEILKLFLDCDKCVFILAVDYEVVTLGIKEKFGDNVSEEKGRSFFDKIIQLPFKMPVAQYDINKYVRNMMEKMSVTLTDEAVELLYTNLIKTSVGCNPRSMKRLFNTYQLLEIISNAAIANKDIDDQVKKRVLFATVCAQMNFEEFYLYLTATKLDTDTFITLTQNPDDNEALKELYPNDNTDAIEKKTKKLSSFLPYFISALKSDNKKELTEDDINILNQILKCSVVTSVNAVSDDEKNDRKWDYYDRNKDIVKKTAEKLTDIGKFVIWIPRAERRDVKPYDISGYCKFDMPAGLYITLGYCVTSKDESHIAVHLYITNQNENFKKEFFNILGDNPLNMTAKPLKEDWGRGRYKYMNILALSDTDTNMPEQIAVVVRNAHAALNDIRS